MVLMDHMVFESL